MFSLVHLGKHPKINLYGWTRQLALIMRLFFKLEGIGLVKNFI